MQTEAAQNVFKIVTIDLRPATGWFYDRLGLRESGTRAAVPGAIIAYVLVSN